MVVLAQHPRLKNDLFTLEKIREGQRLYKQRKEWGWLITLANNGGKKSALLFKEENEHCSKHADNPHQTQIWFLCVNVWSCCNLYESCSSFKWMQYFWNSWNECCLCKETMDVVNKQISCQQLSNEGAENSIKGELSMGFLMIHLSRACSVQVQLWAAHRERVSPAHSRVWRWAPAFSNFQPYWWECVQKEGSATWLKNEKPMHSRWFRCSFTFLAPDPFPQDTLPQKGILHYGRAW